MPPADGFDRLVEQDARVKRVSRMVPDSGPLTDSQRNEIRTALDAFMAEHKLTQADVAKAIGQSATYVSNLLTRATSLPPATRDQILRDLNNWLDREARARDSQRPGDFVSTAPARRLIALAERLTERADMALAFGPAGIGKTTTIEAITAEIPTAIAVGVDHDSRYPTGLLTKIFNAISRKKRAGGVRLAEVIDKLRKPERVATHNLLILDEAHKLADRSIVVLAELHDKARCSILFVGTIDLKRRLATDDEPELGQISSRVGMRIALAPELAGTDGTRGERACFTVEEIRKLFSRGKVKLHRDAARMLANIANSQRGTLRRVSRLFDWAEVAARKDGADAITVAHLQMAMGLVEDDIELMPVEDAPAVAVQAG